MRFQQDEYSCGPAALVNAFRVLGKTYTQDQVASLCGTSLDGTDEEELKRGVGLLGGYWGENPFSTTVSGDSSLVWLRDNMKCRYPTLLCVDAWEHWVTLIGVCGARYIIFDPQKTSRNIRENGIKVYSPRQLRSRWWKAGDEIGKGYYGLAIYL